MTKRILVPIAPGTEEMGMVTIIDILVRAGYQVVVASADFEGKLTMKASRGVTLTAGWLISQMKSSTLLFYRAAYKALRISVTAPFC